MLMIVKEAERLLKKAGFKEVYGDKGSYRKIIKPNHHRPVILTSRGKELSLVVEKIV